MGRGAFANNGVNASAEVFSAASFSAAAFIISCLGHLAMPYRLHKCEYYVSKHITEMLP